MKNRYTLLRHAETVKDPSVHPKDWLLTPDALLKINDYIGSDKFTNITKIISSTEPKAVATGKPIANFLKLEIEELEEFVEVKREKKFLTDEEFLALRKNELENRDVKANGIESGNEVIARFKSGIDKLEEKYVGENILIITHGTIMTLYLADHRGDFTNIFQNWLDLKTKFCELVEVV